MGWEFFILYFQKNIIYIKSENCIYAISILFSLESTITLFRCLDNREEYQGEVEMMGADEFPKNILYNIENYMSINEQKEISIDDCEYYHF
jgi:hypothetical protein